MKIKRFKTKQQFWTPEHSSHPHTYEIITQNAHFQQA
jgi:hypothetical protein